MNKCFALVLLVLLAVSGLAVAGGPEKGSSGQGYAPLVQPAKFDSTPEAFYVDGYYNHIYLPMCNDSLYGRLNIFMCTAVPNVYWIAFNCQGLQVDSIINSMSGMSMPFMVNDSMLEVNVDMMMPGCFFFDVYYRGGNFSKGLYWKPKGPGQEQGVAYTMSEPEGARCWMPCVDVPWHKVSMGSDLYITVPDSFMAAGNGRLADTTRDGNLLTWHWNNPYPVAPYQIGFAVSRYSMICNTAIIPAGDDIPLQYFVWPGDSVTASAVFDSVPSMLECLNSKLSKYPFDRYGMMATSPLASGGMEHAIMSIIDRSWITGNNQTGLVHELAHQWFGGQRTCGHWSDIWLNEGLAGYGEAIYREWQGNRPGDFMIERFHAALGGNADIHPILDPPAELLSDWSLISCKGAWVAHMLRWTLGDPAFFRTLRLYCDSLEKPYHNGTTHELDSLASLEYGQPLDWFFDQWLTRAGHPIYTTVKYFKTQGDSNSAIVRLAQTSTTGELYTMPLALACSTSAGLDSTIVVWDSLAVQEFAVGDDQPVLGVKLDPDNWVLKEVYDSLPELSSLNTVFRYGGSLIGVYWHKFWADSGCAGYNVYRSENPGGPYARINADAVTDTSYLDTTTYGGTEYYYAVTAVSSTDTCYETHFSNVLSLVAGQGGVEGNPGDSGPITGNGLWQNTPNPFKQLTMINYQLAKTGVATLKVYNIQGQLVKVLVQGAQGAGRHTVSWDGRDHAGQNVSSGVYICRMSIGGKSFVKRMQFIR
jgi:hypothetical protein